MKDILICVAGATPQIVTETIYALSKNIPPVFVKELYIITTSHGKQLIADTLIRQGMLKRLIEEYRLPGISFTEDCLIVIKNSHDVPLQDIRDNEENEAAGDIITGFIREKARDVTIRLHCSIAGGRKTMGFYLGGALQLFGRPWDKLYHVLVSPEFESNPDFFYPPRKPKLILCRMPDGKEKKISTDMAGVQLAELPFIRLKEKLRLGSNNFRELVRQGQEGIDTALMQEPLRVNLSDRSLEIGDRTIDFTPMELSLYIILMERKLSHCPHPERKYCLECTDCYTSVGYLTGREGLNAFIACYERIFGKDSLKGGELYEKYGKRGGISSKILRQVISKVRRKIEDGIRDKTHVPFYTITSIGAYGSTQYGLRLEKGKMVIG
ncbi:MAG: TIGR02584 family CRISPR-associated protein [Candidatus Brocadia sp. AMX2]|uniref:CRISPR-associated protein NE01113 family n=1 Tax=Candidatus Brocadia sinica JPN1 TaxID=1197129 RepID=A0ABQ0JTM2_9BACT|nr:MULTISPECIES: CRISPR-associated ring nuclease Csm6 [Brocadia]MBC6931981.1 TIGR02584 family CRISPR-associated protein [Candidatus Brocadia sp.]MBL1168255.1 TIGR02584 family CRISPR-associated protein [Candidatus Brocadia sp. AMX1]NOG39972.1 TIGR02584 family CRISPR-associated protein [Planctomycetota bacterium]GIK12860.1 MAG: CRISPR-associated protein [Candidatus Brocadia sinica]KAA0243486.1 MAG: TIGR02584 family CRISPR-associated protein [Candidatus Brocadia sp. AMX2]